MHLLRVTVTHRYKYRLNILYTAKRVCDHSMQQIKIIILQSIHSRFHRQMKYLTVASTLINQSEKEVDASDLSSNTLYKLSVDYDSQF